MNDSKKYNLNTFLSFFAKSMIEAFIPIILYKRGFSINNIFVYLMFQYLISIFVIWIIPVLDKYIKYKGLVVINTIFFIIGYTFLFYIKNTTLDLFLLALFHTIHGSIFWILRHIYTIKIYPNNNLSKNVGNILISTEAAYLFSSYIGAFILDKYNQIILTIIASIILVIANIFLLSIKIKTEDSKMNFSILKSLKIKNILFFIAEQFKVIGIVLFPLYITIFLKVSYKFIGIFNIFIGISSIIFIFLFSRLINKKKKSYMLPCACFYSLLWILKINIGIKILVLLIAFLEGITSKIYQTSTTRFLYSLGHHFNTIEYVTVIEMLFSLIRFIIILIAFLFIKDLKILLYICSIGLLLTGFIKFNDLND